MKKIAYSCGYVPDYSVKFNIQTERTFKNMTSIIGMKSASKICVGADSWNTNSINNHFLQKIFVDKDKKIIVASAGDNSKSYDGGKNVLYIKDLINQLFKNSISFQDFYENLINKTKSFLEDMDISNGARFIQYYIAWIENNNIQTKRIEIKKTNGQQIVNNEKIILKEMNTNQNYYMYMIDFTNDNNPSFACLGTYASIFNSRKNNLYRIPKDTDNMKKIVLNKIKQQMQMNQKMYKKKDAPKAIGNNIYVVEMNSLGDIKTYIDGEEKQF